MKLVKSLLLGSAAGLCAVAGAQAADLPVRKAAPVEYVRVCTAYGAGFFYIPGTDTCLRVGGRARFEAQFVSNRSRNADLTGYRGLGRLNLDARTQTPYGTLRAFVRFEIASRTGAQLTSGTQQRYANAFFATGQDTFGRDQKYVDVDKAFIQFAGLTAGRAASFFDFYAHDLEFSGLSVGSDAPSTNLLAYTATFGQGFSATISMEDPIWRRNPTAAAGGTVGLAVTSGGAGSTSQTAAGNIILGSSSISPVLNSAGTFSNLDITQRNRLPDFVGALRYDQPWGSAQLSGAVHEIAMGTYVAGTAAGVSAPIPSNEYGFAVQGGLKLNLPQIAPGDVLWLQAAYAQGAGSYTGVYVPQGSELNASAYTNQIGSALGTGAGGFDSAVDLNGRQHLTESFSGTIAFLHYWSPEVRQGVFASAGRVHFDGALRSGISPLNGSAAPVFTVAGGGLTAAARFNAFGKDYNNFVAGSNLIWSPVRDLDIGVEALYERIEFVGGGTNGRVFDQNKLNGRTTTSDDNVIVRMRVQRDF
jgi:hypothetical protein